MNWVNDVGEELVLDAMQRALERGKSNWSYVKGILQAWAKKGITTVEDAKAEEAAFRRSRQQGDICLPLGQGKLCRTGSTNGSVRRS
ncbi:DnaD domain-containing protein [Lentibacillus cibarius]